MGRASAADAIGRPDSDVRGHGHGRAHAKGEGQGQATDELSCGGSGGKGGAVHVQVKPMTENGSSEEVGLAIPAKATAPEEAVDAESSRWTTPSIAKAAEACKHDFYWRAGGGEV